MNFSKGLLAIALLVSLAGCGDDDDDAQSPSETTTTRIPGLPGPVTTEVQSIDFPNDGNTGVPGGAVLESKPSMVLTEDNSYIEGFQINGTVRVQANGVTIKRSRINTDGLYPIQIDKGYGGLVVEDVEINGNGKSSVAVLGGGYSLHRVNIHSVKDGPRIEGDNVTIEDSYVHDLTRVEGGHHDAIQIRKGVNIMIRHNSLIPYNADTKDPMNAAIQIGSPLGTTPISNLVVDDNFMNGGNYTINGGENWVTGAVYSDNQFGRDFRYGVATAMGEGSVWESTNVFADNGAPAS